MPLAGNTGASHTTGYTHAHTRGAGGRERLWRDVVSVQAGEEAGAQARLRRHQRLSGRKHGMPHHALRLQYTGGRGREGGRGGRGAPLGG